MLWSVKWKIYSKLVLAGLRCVRNDLHHFIFDGTVVLKRYFQNGKNISLQKKNQKDTQIDVPLTPQEGTVSDINK